MTPRTKAGHMLLMAGLTFHSGRRLADHPELILAIEDEADEAHQRVDGLRAALVSECGMLPAHKHPRGADTCVGCDLHRRIANLLGRFPKPEPR